MATRQMASLPYMFLDLLALGICSTWATVIALRDLAKYRISNRSLIWGLALVWPSFFALEQKLQLNLASLLLAIIALVVGLASLVGMGDVKLVLFFAPWLHYDNLRDALILLILISWLQLLAGQLIQGRFPRRIAFAPAILLAAALNMAT